VKRFRGGLVFEAHRLVYYSTLGSRVIKKKKKKEEINSEEREGRDRGVGARDAYPAYTSQRSPVKRSTVDC